MDQKLLDAFNNLSVALQQISDALNTNNKNNEKNSSAIVDSLKNLDIIEQVKSIDEGVKKLQSDSKKIVSEQKKLSEMVQKMSKREDSKIIRTEQEAIKKRDEGLTGIGPIKDEKSKRTIMDGVKVIVLIAAGIMALGLAFKIVGEVDWKSVIALSLAMPLIAVAFEKISSVKVSLKDLAIANLGLVMMSVAIVASSFILREVRTVSLSQILTTVLIAGAFALLSYNIGKLASSTKNVNVKDLWKMPLVLIAASAAIALSSHILQYVKPVGILQLLTTVLIAGAFALLSYSIGKLASSIKNVDVKDLWKMPLVLVAASAAIALSSHILQYVKPVGILQLLTAVLIAGVFTVLSFGLSKLVKSMKNIDVGSLVLLPIVLVAMSAAIMLSSHILVGVKPISLGLLVNIALQSITLTVVSIAMGFAMNIITDKFKLTPSKAIKSGLTMVIIATTIMATSMIIGLGEYNIYPSLLWTLGTAASMLAFGVAMSVIGLSGLSLPALAIGAVGVMLIAATILATDSIISNGDYSKYPSLKWIGGVGVSLAAFGLVMAASGIGFVALAIGYLGIELIAKSIVNVSNIISGGNYNGGPSLTWAIGTGSLITAFGAVIIGLGAFIGGTLGLGYLALKAGASGVKIIAQSIVDSSFILGKGRYTGGPTKQWSEGVSLAIGAFAPVYKTLTDGGILKTLFAGGGTSPKQMKQAILTISEGIIAAAGFFSDKKVAFKNGIPVEWASGVGKAIEAFAPVFKSLGNSGIFAIFTGGGASSSQMKEAILAISEGIIETAKFFDQNIASFNNYPKYEWSKGVGDAIIAFGPAFKWASDNSSWFEAGTDFLKETLVAVAESIVDISKILQSGKFNIIINKDWISGIKESYRSFIDVISIVDKIGKSGLNKISDIASSIVGISNIISKGLYNTIISPEWIDGLKRTYYSFLEIINISSDIGKKALDRGISKITDMSSTISTISRIISNGAYDTLIPLNWMSNLTSNLINYQKLLDYLSGTTNISETLGLNLNAMRKSYDLSKMSRDYDKLANSIQNLSSSIQEINIEKINALKTLTGSVVLMSLMDSDQFESMIDALENKAGSLVDVIKQVENGFSGTEIKLSSQEKEKGVSMDDLLVVMNRMDSRLGQIAATNNNISNYVNQLRSNPNNNTSLKKK